MWRRSLDEAALATPDIEVHRRMLDEIFPPDERNSATYTAYYTPYAALVRRREAAGAETRAEKCSDLDFDLPAGTLGGVLPSASMEDLKDRFPCFTSEAPDYGGERIFRAGLLFARHGMTFFTMRQYIEVRTGFPARCRLRCSAGRRPRCAGSSGPPDAIGRNREGQVMLFERDYGCLATVSDRPVGSRWWTSATPSAPSSPAHIAVRGLQWQ